MHVSFRPHLLCTQVEIVCYDVTTVPVYAVVYGEVYWPLAAVEKFLFHLVTLEATRLVFSSFFSWDQAVV